MRLTIWSTVFCAAVFAVVVTVRSVGITRECEARLKLLEVNQDPARFWSNEINARLDAARFERQFRRYQ